MVPGYAYPRAIELLVEAGFSPEQAIQIATANGARHLEQDDIGTIAAGKRADLVVIDGNPVADITDLYAIELVFKTVSAFPGPTSSSRCAAKWDCTEFAQLSVQTSDRELHHGWTRCI